MTGRRSFLAACAATAASSLVTPRVSAGDVVVPVSLQAELLAKVAAYDKNLASRAGARVHILIVTKSGDLASERAGNQMKSALATIDSIASLPHDEEAVSFSSAAAIAAAVKQKKTAIVWFGPGLSDGEVGAVAAALTGGDVLSVAALGEQVPKGMVLGFDLVSGKPKLLVHLGQAKKQHVDFKADVLKLMKVYE